MRRLIDERDCRGCYRATARVRDRAANAAAGALRAGKRRGEQNPQCDGQKQQNAATPDQMDLLKSCLYLHELTPYPDVFFTADSSRLLCP